MSFTHLITSGCSFSARGAKVWPEPLAEKLNLTLENYGCASAGNSWIAKSCIYGIQNLLDSGIAPESILAVVMWSSHHRKDAFISQVGTAEFKQLRADRPGETVANPVNFIDPAGHSGLWETGLVDGYLLGSASCAFGEHITRFKRDLILNFFNDEALIIESYENILRLQWYCESKKIVLINHTFMDIMHYNYVPGCPHQSKLKLLPDQYTRNVKPLHNMINFDKWLFWNVTGGLYEYTKDNNLPFSKSDGVHPEIEANEHYVDNYLIPYFGVKLGINTRDHC